MAERERILNKKDARALGIFLGLSTVVAFNAAPRISCVVEKLLISSNTNDYSIVTGINRNFCYTKDYPILLNGLQLTQLHDAYCPVGIDGETKFIELVIPTSTITSFPEKK